MSTEPEKPPPQVIRPSPVEPKWTIFAPTVWLTYSFAPEWFSDASNEAKRANDHNARRREIVYSVCFVETYLFEWARDQVLDRDFDRLTTYFPFGDRRGIRDKWKEVVKALEVDNLIAACPGFDTPEWNSFVGLVKLRNGLIHALASRPDTTSLTPDQAPIPSKADLDDLDAGWAVRVAVDVVTQLHAAAGSSIPGWLKYP